MQRALGPAVQSRLIVILAAVALTAHAQESNAVIEQARLSQKQQPVNVTPKVTADGAALPDNESDTSDESFGAQLILKEQPHWRPFQVFGDASVIYTNNVALTNNDMKTDGSFVGSGGVSWSPKLSGGFDLQVVGRASTVAYFDTSELDFTNVGAGVGVSYTFQTMPTVSAFARYDFIELLGNDGQEILSDHEFTAGLQKIFALGRSHFITTGLLGSAGISDPSYEQRDQISGYVGYHLNLTRSLSTDLLYRMSGSFYNNGGRSDLNNVLTWTMHYRLSSYAEMAAFLSYADNRSSHTVFDYDVFTTGGGIAVNVRF